MKLRGKVAVITGAGRGIGEVAAAKFAEEGCSVVCVDIASGSAEESAARISAAGGSAIGVTADVSTEDGNSSMIDEAVSAFGGLDILYANAAIQAMGQIDAIDAAQWDSLYRTNLRGVFLGVQSALPALRSRGGGSLLITASLLGIVGDPDMPAYGAMKGGLRAFCRAVATAHGPENIRCNTICPGDVQTPMGQDFFAHQADPVAARKVITDRYPLRRFATPRDVANVAAFLASDEASYLSGIDVVVDGGLLARIY